MSFNWSKEKNLKNFKKHSVRFDESQSCWMDPMAIEFLDDIYLVNEERYLKIGLSNKLRLLVTVFTEDINNNTIRIISSRIATKSEAHLYEKRI